MVRQSTCGRYDEIFVVMKMHPRPYAMVSLNTFKMKFIIFRTSNYRLERWGKKLLKAVLNAECALIAHCSKIHIWNDLWEKQAAVVISTQNLSNKSKSINFYLPSICRVGGDVSKCIVVIVGLLKDWIQYHHIPCFHTFCALCIYCIYIRERTSFPPFFLFDSTQSTHTEYGMHGIKHFSKWHIHSFVVLFAHRNRNIVYT